MKQRVTQKRTQIYLPYHLYRSVKQLARKKEVSMAKVVREAIEQYSTKSVGYRELSFMQAKARFLRLAGIGKGPKDLARNHDKYW